MLYAIPCFSQSASPCRISNRFQLSLEHDSNVEESLKRPSNAFANKLVFQTKIKRAGKHSFLSFGYHGGLSIYNNYSSENKLINEGFLNHTYFLTNRFHIGVKSFGRIKLFLNKETDYAFGNLSPFVQFSFNPQNSLEIGYLSESLDYAHSIQYDFANSAAYTRFVHRLRNGASFGLFYKSSRYKFDRLTNTLNLDFSKLDHQKDHVQHFSVSTDFMYQGFLFNVVLNYETNFSNSYGFAYQRQFVNLILAKQTNFFLIRSYITWQNKNYLDEFLPTWPIELDTEREESNFLVVDVSRDITGSLSGMVRIAWYKNESPLASLYYNKTLLSCGLELRFPEN